MLLDIGVGILLSMWMSSLFHAPLSAWLVGVGILCTLVPDIDFLVELAKHGSVGGRFIREHRELTHFPILYIPVVGIAFALWGPMGAIMLGVGVFMHFVHDSMGIGWGIKWLWPFSKKAYKFFSEKNGDFSTRLLVSWHHDELLELAATHGHPDWFRHIYLHMHPINIIESCFFIVSLIIFYLWAG